MFRFRTPTPPLSIKLSQAFERSKDGRLAELASSTDAIKRLRSHRYGSQALKDQIVRDALFSESDSVFAELSRWNISESECRM